MKINKPNISSNKPNVLIIDDEPRLLEYLSALLRKHFHVYTAEDGEKGLLAYKLNSPVSIILLDLDLPVLNGIDMLARIRRDGDNVKTIIMTGKSSHDWAVRCADLHIHGYIQKPFCPEKLIRRMKKLLGLDEVERLHKLLDHKDEHEIASISNTVKRAIKYLQANYNNYNIREDVAVYLNITADHLCKLMKRECGITLKICINKIRIQESINHLQNDPNLKIKDVSYAVGQRDVNYFCKLFKKQTGMTPTQFTKTF